jgi:mono/diheme cytochrome c family protein
MAETHELEVAEVTIREGDKSALERGKYLVDHVMGCNHGDCHRADFGGGAVVDAMPVGRIYAPNLTGGEGSVTKNYSVKDWVRTIRHGLKPDGTRALVMPSEDYWVFPDEDIAAVIAWIKSQPPVNRESIGHSLGPIGMLMTATEPVFAYDKIDHAAERPKAERGPTLEWGKVMIGACKGCHGDTLSGGLIPGTDPSWPAARNLTPHDTGIKGWTYDNFKAAVTTGKRPDGTELNKAMPWQAYAGMQEDDLQALWKYLQTVAPKEAGGR